MVHVSFSQSHLTGWFLIGMFIVNVICALGYVLYGGRPENRRLEAIVVGDECEWFRNQPSNMNVKLI